VVVQYIYVLYRPTNCNDGYEKEFGANVENYEMSKPGYFGP
jgi:hypothetical protein